MPDYLVCWAINIAAKTPREAAVEALKIMRDVESTATIFDVFDEYLHHVGEFDLQEPDDDA